MKSAQFLEPGIAEKEIWTRRFESHKKTLKKIRDRTNVIVDLESDVQSKCITSSDFFLFIKKIEKQANDYKAKSTLFLKKETLNRIVESNKSLFKKIQDIETRKAQLLNDSLKQSKYISRILIQVQALQSYAKRNHKAVCRMIIQAQKMRNSLKDQLIKKLQFDPISRINRVICNFKFQTNSMLQNEKKKKNIKIKIHIQTKQLWNILNIVLGMAIASRRTINNASFANDLNIKLELFQPEQNEEQPKKKWQKILYEKQDFDDNYTDETFLENVVRQDTSQGPDYKELIKKTTELIFAINSVVLYLIIFYTMLNNLISEQTYLIAQFPIRFILIILLLLSFIGSIVYVLLTQKEFRIHEILSNVKSIGIIISILLLFAPVLQTVNQTYADNTIYVLVSVSVIYHLFTRDYDYQTVAEPQTWKVNSSTHAALFFSSLLASRLSNEFQVFVMIYTYFLFFVFAQFLKKAIKDYSPRGFKVGMVIISLIIIVFLLLLSFLLTGIYVGVIFFITFISPLQLIWMYQYKNTIQGPWDLPDVKQYE